LEAGREHVSFIDVWQGDGVLVQVEAESYLIGAGHPRRDRTWSASCAAGSWTPSMASWSPIPQVDRTPGLGFRALLTEDGIERLEVARA
jgi:hypothetical protein